MPDAKKEVLNKFEPLGGKMLEGVKIAAKQRPFSFRPLVSFR
jgi:hypothetical protein